MNRTRYEDLQELAPDGAVDDTGLEVARAALERGRRHEQAGGMLTVGGSERLVALGSRRAWGVGRVLVLLTATVLVLGVGALGAVLVKGMAQPADVGPRIVKPDTRTGPTASPSPTPEGEPSVRCDDLNSTIDGAPEIPSAEWPGLMDHGWTLPDVPVTASPTLQGAPAECAGDIAAVVFADPADDRAVAVYEQVPFTRPLAPDVSLAEAEVGALPSGDQFVRWTDEHGNSRWAQAGGVSAEEFRVILESLTYREDGSVTGPVPGGFERVETPEIKPGTTLYLWRMWHYEGMPYLWVTWPVTTPIEASLADGRDYEAVEFDGGVALYSGGLPGSGSNPPSLKWDKDGARFWLLDSGADLETLKARARSVRPLELDDPQLVPFLRR